ncbi:hypothetical protein VCUG_00743 [Vavraia culicis subsp. floridensis]|uniref:Uncharacterized protein n=1 Tax=Vavraia culicis (isolate floridensis) TaxID=948595 RepID=L2GWQ0_VAVCU|nr:uncharacterized protein VCUG_00743 [Vavraia culicis subsp. floridensis]ELA47782.1 hypothetical protein VCUG_00743 [Vavraia culicis subsp. floridensis]
MIMFIRNISAMRVKSAYCSAFIPGIRSNERFIPTFKKHDFYTQSNFLFFLKRVNLKMPFDERYKLTIDIIKHFHHMNINGFAVVLNIFLMLNTWCSSKNAVKAV